MFLQQPIRVNCHLDLRWNGSLGTREKTVARILLKAVHCGGNDGYILNVPLWFISSALFWRILGFTGWEHHGHTTGDTAKYSLNEPLGNITVTFFGKLGVYPMYYLMGTSWGNQGKILKIFVMYRVGTYMVHCPFPCNVLVMYQSGTLVLAPSGLS